MAEVTGLPCVLCGQPIESLFDGVFCAECGGPYHHKCFGGPIRQKSGGRCGYCGGDLRAGAELRAKQPQAKSRSSLTLAQVLRLRQKARMFVLKASIAGMGLACVVSGVVLAGMRVLPEQSWWENLALGGALVLGGVVTCALAFIWIRGR